MNVDESNSAAVDPQRMSVSQFACTRMNPDETNSRMSVSQFANECFPQRMSVSQFPCTRINPEETNSPTVDPQRMNVSQFACTRMNPDETNSRMSVSQFANECFPRRMSVSQFPCTRINPEETNSPTVNPQRMNVSQFACTRMNPDETNLAAVDPQRMIVTQFACAVMKPDETNSATVDPQRMGASQFDCTRMNPDETNLAAVDPQRMIVTQFACAVMKPDETNSVTVDPQRGRVSRFAKDLFSYLVKHTLKDDFVMPPPTADMSLFTENIGKSIKNIWDIRRHSLRQQLQNKLPSTGTDEFAIRANLITVMRVFAGKYFNAGGQYSIFQAIKYISAMLLEVIHIYYERGFGSYMYCVLESWLDIFDLHCGEEFYASGGFDALNVSCS